MSANIAYLMEMIERDSEAGKDESVSKARLQLVAEAFASERSAANRAHLVTLGSLLLFGANIDTSAISFEPEEDDQPELVI